MLLPRAIATIVSQVARQSIGKDWSLYAALLEHWQEIVGAEYANSTTPVKITFPHQPNEARRRNGALLISLPKGLTMEFTFKTEIMRERINAYFGYDAIGKVNLEPIYGVVPQREEPQGAVDPTALAEIAETSKSIENDELRAALAAFGEAMLHRSKADVKNST